MIRRMNKRALAFLDFCKIQNYTFDPPLHDRENLRVALWLDSHNQNETYVLIS